MGKTLCSFVFIICRASSRKNAEKLAILAESYQAPCNFMMNKMNEKNKCKTAFKFRIAKR